MLGAFCEAAFMVGEPVGSTLRGDGVEASPLGTQAWKATIMPNVRVTRDDIFEESRAVALEITRRLGR